jgi:hypothetical protein
MSYTLQQVTNEPIMFVKWEGNFTVEDVRAMFDANHQIAQQFGSVYMIVDVTEGEVPMQTVLGITRLDLFEKYPGGVTDPRVRLVFVGENTMADMYAGLMQRMLTIPTFNTVEDAIAFARRRIAEQA